MNLKKILGIVSLGTLLLGSASCIINKQHNIKNIAVDEYRCELKLEQDTVKLYNSEDRLVAKTSFMMGDTLLDKKQEDFEMGCWDVGYYGLKENYDLSKENEKKEYWKEKKKLDRLLDKCIDLYIKEKD